ncbi:MAG TPA: type I methionyl aminopeptidase, partial [Caulobacteraceae bacterium]|nr:type I methionyl aminopeptidase [Caulobacteraceae bacterium]
MTDADVIDPMLANRRTSTIKVHGAEAFEGMRKAGRIAAECLDMLTPHVRPGVVTDDLDRLAREFILDSGA